MMTLAEIYPKHSLDVGEGHKDFGHADKGTIHSYIDEYEGLLAPFRGKCTFMEIGLAQGMSVSLWDEYFGPECTLVGADIKMCFDTSRFPRWKFIEIDATIPKFAEAASEYRFDVVIDDASHDPNHQEITRNMLLPLMNPGGLYIIEDILDLEGTKHRLAGAEIRDLRGKKNRFDDVLVIYHT